MIENHVYEGTHPLRFPPSEEDLDIALGLINRFGSKDYDQIEEEIDNDVTSIPKAREYLKEISKAFLALIKYVDHKTWRSNLGLLVVNQKGSRHERERQSQVYQMNKNSKEAASSGSEWFQWCAGSSSKNSGKI